MLKIYNAATGLPLDKDDLDGLNAGADADPLQVEVWWKKDNPDGSIARNVSLHLRTLDGTGTWVATGVPPQDELWGRIRLTGQDATADPTQEPRTFDWRVWGAWTVAELGDIHAGCARLAELTMHPPGYAEQTNWQWQVVPWYATYAVPTPPAVSDVHRGVLPGVGDRSRSGLVRGGEVTASAPADDQVHVAASHALVRGRLDGLVRQDITLDQTDGAAAALVAGNGYLAVLTRGLGGVTVTKGDQAAAPVEPARPAGEPYLKTVEVRYQSGGTSVIEAGDITGTLLYDRLRVVEGAGAQLLIHPGRSIGGGTYRYRTDLVPVDLPSDGERWLWQTAAGNPELTTTDEPPEDTALPLARAVTVAGAITELQDLRPLAGAREVLRLQGQTGGDPLGGATAIASALVEAAELHVDAATYRLGGNGGGSAGQHLLSYRVNGATAYPGSATDDQRAAIAHDAAGSDLVHRDGIPEVLRLVHGDLLELVVEEVPTGAADVLAELTLTCWRP